MYLRILKPDKTEFQGEDCCSIVDNEIVIDTSIGNGEQILSCAGKNICELHLTDEDYKTLTTWDFVIDVAPRVHTGEGIQSSDSWDVLDTVLENTALFESLLEAHVDNKNNPHEVTMVQLGMDNVENKSSEMIRAEITKDNVTTALGYTPYTPTEVDNKISALESSLDWKETVSTYDEMLAVYANPEKGWTVNVGDENDMTTYRYDGSKWVDIGVTVIPKATESNDGLMSKDDKAKLDTINTFSSVKVGDTTISANTVNDAVELVAGSNITITPDATNDKVTISSTNTTYDLATTTSDGLMSKEDKFKIESLSTGSVIGVKGNAESTYRTGNVNITAENVGAMPSTKLTSSVDFNTLTTTGFYHINFTNGDNKPTTNHGTLIVDFSVGTPYQIWIPDNRNVMYKRYYTTNNTTWYEWTVMDARNADSAINVTAEAGSSDANRHVWFSDGATETKRNYDDDFSYNPFNNTLNVANVNGTANKAIHDTEGRNIGTFLNRFSTSGGLVTVYNGDLNDIDITSFYNVNIGTDKNAPIAAWGFVLTFVHGYATTHMSQIWIGMTTGLMYWRYKSGGWSEWRAITQNTQILNTATAIEASTSSENIVGVQGLKDYLNTTKLKTVTSNDTSIFIDVSQYSTHALVQISIAEKVQGSCLVALSKTDNLWYINKIGGDDTISSGNISANGVKIVNTAKNTITYTIISGV